MTNEERAAIEQFATFLAEELGDNSIDGLLQDYIALNTNDLPDTDDGIICPSCEGWNGAHYPNCTNN